MDHTPHLPNRNTLRQVLIWTVLFSLLAHGYRYLSLGFSGDAMLLSQTGEELYQISLGRFLQPVYWQIRGDITAPLTIGLFATAFLCACAYLTVSLLGIHRPLHIALVCAILTANETMGASNAAYLPWTDVYMLAMALALAGVYLFFHWKWGFFAASRWTASVSKKVRRLEKDWGNLISSSIFSISIRYSMRLWNCFPSG